MPSFNQQAIPATDRTPEKLQVHIEMFKSTQDIIRVHNPTDKIFTVYNDRMVMKEEFQIPDKDSDIGVGKGNLDVPRYIAKRYLEKMGSKLIIEKSRAEWALIREKYRADERGTVEERVALKINNKEEWKKITPILWLGVISRYQVGSVITEEAAPKERKAYTSKSEAALSELGLDDAEFGIDNKATAPSADSKEDFLRKISA